MRPVDLAPLVGQGQDLRLAGAIHRFDRGSPTSVRSEIWHAPSTPQLMVT